MYSCLQYVAEVSFVAEVSSLMCRRYILQNSAQSMQMTEKFHGNLNSANFSFCDLSTSIRSFGYGYALENGRKKFDCPMEI